MDWLYRVRGNEGAIYQCRTRAMVESEVMDRFSIHERWAISVSSVGVEALCFGVLGQFLDRSD